MAWLSLELVKFDTQALIDPEISGAEYQQGTLYGYEVREYLLEKWGRQCAYCGDNNVPLQIEHLIPRIRGGTNPVDNTMIWTLKYGSGRVFQTALGHDVKAMDSPGFRLTLVRGTEWAATGEVTIPVPADLK